MLNSHEVLWHSHERNFTESFHIAILCNRFKSYTFEIIPHIPWPWWRHQMETFSALLAICAGNSPVPGEFPAQRPVTRSFDVSFDLRVNIRLSKQSWGWWFETLSCPLWRHCNGQWVNRCLICVHTEWLTLGIALPDDVDNYRTDGTAGRSHHKARNSLYNCSTKTG